MNQSKRFLQTILLTLSDWRSLLPPFLTGVAGIAFAISNPNLGLLPMLFDPMVVAWFIIILIVVSTCISVANVPYQKTRKAVEQELEKSKTKLDEVANNMPYLFDGILVNLWNKLNLGSDHHARISIYVHHEGSITEEGCFTCCGRYSSNPVIRKPGRTLYPDGQGYIWEGWQRGWHYDAEFPTDEENHEKYNHEKYKIPLEVQKKFKIRTLFCAVKRLDDAENKPRAVIVIEGENRLDHDHLKGELEHLAPDYAHMIKVLRDHIPVPKEAKEKQL